MTEVFLNSIKTLWKDLGPVLSHTYISSDRRLAAVIIVSLILLLTLQITGISSGPVSRFSHLCIWESAGYPFSLLYGNVLLPHVKLHLSIHNYLHSFFPCLNTPLFKIFLSSSYIRDPYGKQRSRKVWRSTWGLISSQRYFWDYRYTPICGFRTWGFLYLMDHVTVHVGDLASFSNISEFQPHFLYSFIVHPWPYHQICRQNLILLPHPSRWCQPVLHCLLPNCLLPVSKILSFLGSLCLAKATPQVPSLSWAITQCCFSSFDGFL